MAGPDLGKMVGPLPLGAWIVVGATGIGIAVWSRSSGDAPASGEATEEYRDIGGVPGVGTGEVGGFVPTTPTPNGEAQGDSPVQRIEDNVSWGARSITWLIAQNYDPATSNNAITKALASGDLGPLTVREFALWTAALARYGAPPEPVTVGIPSSVPGPVTTPPPPPTNTPPPAKPPVSAPRVFRYHTVRPGQTLSGIAKRYPGTTWREIYNANRYGRKRADGKIGKIRNPNLIMPGWKLLIPK